MPSCTAASYNFNNNNGNGNGNGRALLPRRKFSFPAAFHSHHLQSDAGGGVGCDFNGPSLAVATARRRFSNVSDVVSRKLSHTIGWRTAVPTEQIARQGKALCAQYVRWKLRRAGAYTRSCAAALRRARAEDAAVASGASGPGADGASDDDATTTAGGAGGSYFIPSRGGCTETDHDDRVRRDVFPAVLRVGVRLERLDPKLYAAGQARADAAARDFSAAAAAAAACSTASSHPPVANRFRGGRDPVADAAASAVLVAVSRELFRAGAQVTWAKVVSLVCVAAGLAVDCARRGRADQLPDLVEAVGEVIEDDLAAWIHYNGGWVSNLRGNPVRGT